MERPYHVLQQYDHNKFPWVSILVEDICIDYKINTLRLLYGMSMKSYAMLNVFIGIWFYDGRNYNYIMIVPYFHLM